MAGKLERSDDGNLPPWVKPGMAFRVYYGPGHPSNRKYHVRAIVDGMAVVRRWRASKQYWYYEVLEFEWFQAFGDHLFATRTALAEDASRTNGGGDG